MAVDRPPADITPSDFFTSWIPAQFAQLRQSGGQEPIPDVTARFVLEGEGGGRWTLTIAGSELSAAASGSDEGNPDVEISQQLNDWRALLSQEISLPGGGGGGGASKLLTNAAAIQAVRDLSGSIRFEITGFQGRNWSVGVAFKGAVEPSATISVGAETLQQIGDGTLEPTQAFFGGKITMGGDAAFAMQVGMALMVGMS